MIIRKSRIKKYSTELRSEYKSIDSSRDLYASIREANKSLRKLRALEKGGAWSENPKGWAWVRLKLVELMEYLSFELLLMLRKVLFGLAVLIGWVLVVRKCLTAQPARKKQHKKHMQPWKKVKPFLYLN